MKLSGFISAVALLTLAIGVPVNFLDPEEQQSGANLQERQTPLQFNKGINIIKSWGFVANGGLSAGKIVITGAVKATGAISDIFKENNRGADIALAAYSHLQRTMTLIDTGSNAVNSVLQHCKWLPSYGEYQGATGASITAVTMMDTSSAALQLHPADFDLLVDTISNYWTSAGCVVNEWWAVSGNAFEDFPVPAPGTTRRSEDGPTVARGNMDLQAQQVCQRPIDMRKYFSNNDVPQMPTTTVAC